MIVVDTGVLVALLDADDQHHQRCRDWYIEAQGPLIVPTPVMVETCYFVERDSSPELEANFLRSFDDGGSASPEEQPFFLAQIEPADRKRMAELIEQYADFPLGAVDASVIAVAERLNVAEVATIDHRHFTVVRPRHTKTFTLLP
ncbi:PIN domain-containing protein [Phytoactinopolyspora mesophila]|uniref:Ribonuclease VapC n=1 Tax=Phytoactinopolyspora mesophila TaxID=2650750 RepID=A0A7K3MBK2_9ACTN|nr:PIN domain-containing protein [Phytoactinopolyspora mesophila]